MYFSSDAWTAFGVSMLLSFFLTTGILLAIAAKRGLFRIGSKSNIESNMKANMQYSGPLLMTPTAPPMEGVPEQTLLQKDAKISNA